jgi:hypothetical protein
MAPTLARPPFHRPGWVYEEKVDGWRMLAYKDGPRVRLISRQHVDDTRRFRELANAIASPRPRATAAVWNTWAPESARTRDSVRGWTPGHSRSLPIRSIARTTVKAAAPTFGTMQVRQVGRSRITETMTAARAGGSGLERPPIR